MLSPLIVWHVIVVEGVDQEVGDAQLVQEDHPPHTKTPGAQATMVTETVHHPEVAVVRDLLRISAPAEQSNDNILAKSCLISHDLSVTTSIVNLNVYSQQYYIISTLKPRVIP